MYKLIIAADKLIVLKMNLFTLYSVAAVYSTLSLKLTLNVSVLIHFNLRYTNDIFKKLEVLYETSIFYILSTVMC